MGPKVSKGRAESPLVASAEAKSAKKQEKARKRFPLPATRNQFLVGGFVRLRADEVLSHTGKYPKGAGGGQRVHGTWPPPDPLVAKEQCTASLAGARPAGFTSVPGRATVAFGAADPSPAPRRRSILGVLARYRHGSAPMQRHAPRHQGQAKCVPAAASDWLRAPGQTKDEARCGPCRSSDKGKCP